MSSRTDTQGSIRRASMPPRRRHWLGYAFADDAVLVRAGRMNVPFGVRSIEHTMFVRVATRTDLNETQQYGVAVAYTGELLRGEVMGILGNCQLSPDAYRERGYSAHLELAPLPRAALGVSSLVTHAPHHGRRSCSSRSGPRAPVPRGGAEDERLRDGVHGRASRLPLGAVAPRLTTGTLLVAAWLATTAHRARRRGDVGAQAAAERERVMFGAPHHERGARAA